MKHANSNLDVWDNLYKNGIQGKYPSEMLIRFINLKFHSQKNAQFLDLGSGTGRHLVYLQENGYNCFGIEHSQLAIDIARAWLDERGLKSNIKQGSIMDESLYEQGLDGIIDIATLQHNTKSEIKKIIKIVHHSLKKGGYFFSMLKHPHDSLFSEGEKFDGSTKKFIQTSDKHAVQALINFPNQIEVKEMFSIFSHLNLEKISWTYNNQKEVVADWIITAKK